MPTIIGGFFIKIKSFIGIEPPISIFTEEEIIKEELAAKDVDRVKNLLKGYMRIVFPSSIALALNFAIYLYFDYLLSTQKPIDLVNAVKSKLVSVWNTSYYTVFEKIPSMLTTNCSHLYNKTITLYPYK